MELPVKEVESILNAINDFFLVISPEREIIGVNDAFLKHMNYTRDRVIGRKCYEVFKEVTRKSSNCHSVCPLEEVVRNRKHCQVELTRIGPDGEPRYAELTIFPMWGKKGEITRFVEISRDITKRKRDEQEMTRRLEKMVEERTRQLQNTQEKMLHQNKMASLGKLSASVVHEINNPVTGILNLTKLIQRILKEDSLDCETVDLLLNHLRLMETETRRIGRIASNLLMFARQSKAEMKQLDVHRLIDETLSIDANMLKINHITIEKHFADDLPLVYGSEDQLRQVFMNLTFNAAESMSLKEGGTLIITTAFEADDGGLCIQFSDTGTGIPEANIPKLFEPFFSTKKEAKGVGLGLSVVYGIIQEHGGTIEVTSRPGQGASFTIRLPLRQ